MMYFKLDQLYLKLSQVHQCMHLMHKKNIKTQLLTAPEAILIHKERLAVANYYIPLNLETCIVVHICSNPRITSTGKLHVKWYSSWSEC